MTFDDLFYVGLFSRRLENSGPKGQKDQFSHVGLFLLKLKKFRVYGKKRALSLPAG